MKLFKEENFILTSGGQVEYIPRCLNYALFIVGMAIILLNTQNIWIFVGAFIASLHFQIGIKRPDEEQDEEQRDEAEGMEELIKTILTTEGEHKDYCKLAKAAAEVMDMLKKHGPSVVPHLMDSDENAGERLREEIAKAKKRGLVS